MNLRRALPLLIIAGLVLAGCATAAPSTEIKPQLTVSGTGLVRVTPDTASINLGVSTQDTDVVQAVAASNLAAEAIISSVKNLGVAPEDVRTTYFNVSPQPMYDQTGMPTGQTTYWVNNTLVITLRQVDQLGALLQAAVDAGANSINGISFDLTDKSQAEEQARQAAMADAQQRAASGWQPPPGRRWARSSRSAPAATATAPSTTSRRRRRAAQASRPFPSRRARSTCASTSRCPTR